MPATQISPAFAHQMVVPARGMVCASLLYPILPPRSQTDDASRMRYWSGEFRLPSPHLPPMLVTVS